MGKRFFNMMMCILLFGIITACSTSQSASNNHDNMNILTIGISQIVEHPALDAIREGIIVGLEEDGYVVGKNIEVNVKNAQGNMENAIAIANGFVQDQVDMIITIATPTTQAAAQATKEIPIVFAAVTDPVAAGLVDALNEVKGNITGTSDQVPMEMQVSLIQRFLPNITDLGVIYSTSEINSEVQVHAIEEAATNYGITIHRAGITNSSEVRIAAESIVNKVDAILIPVDNTVVSAFEGVLTVAEKEKIPVFASDTDTVKRGAVATYGIDYAKMGVQTGAMAARILNGESIQSNPVEITKHAELAINLHATNIFGIDIPEDIMNEANEIIKK